MNAKEQAVAAIDRARAEMEEALNHLEHLPVFDAGTIAFAAHALQSYLTIIDGTAELLDEKFRDHRDPEVVRWLQGIQHTTQLMSHTVCQMMNGASGGGPSLKLVEVNLPLLVNRACSYYGRIAARKKIAIEFNATHKTPSVWVDRVALAAVLDNLLSNAVKYSPPESTVRVDVRSEPHGVVCAIPDQGPGISEADQQKLFQKGVRLSATPTGGEPSAGYGLAVAKDLVKRIGGDLRCESKLGAGACFSIHLPDRSAGATST